ncbi:MAG: tetratricopeptide repeat protein [Rhizomicrobium sp.]|jgi:tetratricopeptide (TPR) repeat protein
MTDPFFQRYRAEDRVSLGQRVEILRARVADAMKTGDASEELKLRNELGFDLTPLDRESEAVAVLEPALKLARRLGKREVEIEVLLSLGTARQYLGERETAQELFREALDKSAIYGIDEHTNFILHHQGRCYAEQGDLAAARQCFEQALELRRKIGKPRFIDSTRRALATLDEMERTR